MAFLTLVLALVLTGVADKVSASICPKGWTEFNGECLYFGSTRHTWVDAATACRHMNHSYLATDDNSDKHNFIKQIAEVFYSMGKSNFWLGGSDFGREGEWRWLETGRPMGPVKEWAPGSPDGNNTENCLVSGFIDDAFYWKDADCKKTHYYVCERQAVYPGIVIG